MTKGRKAAVLLSAVMAVSGVATQFVGCTPAAPDTSVTYRTFTTTLPSNWNELTYEDNNDTQILSYIGSSFFDYDYKFDDAKGGKYNEDGTVNADAIVSGGFTTNYSAATALVDVTSTVDAKWGYTDKQKAEGGYAWKITLREDLKWDDGTPIEAADFIYSMQEQLNPDFMNYRANTYYDSLYVKNAKDYLYGGKSGYDAADFITGDVYNEADDELYIWKLSSATDDVTEDAMSTIRASYNSGYEAYGLSSEQTASQYLLALGVAFGAPLSLTADQIDALEGKTVAQIKADPDLKATFDYLLTWWDEGDAGALDFTVMYYQNPEVAWDTVGLYSPSKYELVLCMDASIQALTDDDTLSYLAAYYLSSLPLVKKDLYEKCKIAPSAGSKLWTTNYNTSLKTSASWGPYKLTQFQNGKSYTLTKNENWYGYAMEQYQGQYNIEKINCQVVAETSTQWMGFLSGKFDSIGIDTDHLEYVNSKYAIVNYGSTAYGIQIYSGVDKLKNSGRNNGILAIQDFRQAMSLMMDRDEFNQTVFGTLPASYGIIGEGYYADIEQNVVYRDTPQAKKALLRTYGFTENDDGTWFDGINTYDDVDTAYDAMNGYNPTMAKQYLASAIAELNANADMYGYDASKPITFLYGATNASETSTKKKLYMQNLLDELTAGTELEGKITVEMDPSYGSTWSDSFKAGEYDLCIIAGIGGNVFNPYNMIGSFVNPKDSLKFSSWWDSSTEMITFTMPAGDYDGAGQEHTMSVVNWFFCLNGNAEANGQKVTYNWGTGVAPYEARLEVLAMLEEYVLSKFFSIQCSFDAEMALDGAKFSNISNEYNTFMGYGGIRYAIANYNNDEWSKFVKSHNNNLTEFYKQEA